jgi:hypothetical protein
MRVISTDASMCFLFFPPFLLLARFLKGNYTEGSGLCVTGSSSFEKDNTFGSIKTRSGSVRCAK